MSDHAYQIQYRQEFIATFEATQSLVRDTVTTEVEIKGNQATFLVAGSGGATAVTRGLNGLIPARADDLTQTTATLAEWHDKVNKTNFNVFASQGNQRAIMQRTTMAVINRKIDSDIMTALGTATNDTGAAVTADPTLVVKAKTILGVNKVPFDSNIFAVISPSFEGYLMLAPEFANRQYIDNNRPWETAGAAWRDQPRMYFWMGVYWIVHPTISGIATNAEICFMYHRSAIGHAIDMAGIEAPIGYNEEHAYSWCRASVNMGSVLLQNSGVVVMNHDGSGWAAS